MSELNAYYPDIFKAFWSQFDAMVASGDVVSTREVRPEVERSGKDNIIAWIKAHSQLFTMPTAQETAFVAEVFVVPHFQALIGQKALLRGTPVADPFLIACAKETRNNNRIDFRAWCCVVDSLARVRRL